MKKIHVIPHTHWDKEWYFTSSRSKVYFCKYFQDIMQTLEENKDFSYFTLDGQSSLIEDYIHWQPEDFNRIKKLVEDGRLLIGPWYTQSDQLIISGESIIRNLYYGIHMCEKFGKFMKVGYVPDSFGQAGNMPQIFKSFDLHNTLFWRGTTDEHISFTDFIWQGDDGTCVLAKQIPYSYALGGKIPEGENDASKFWDIDCLKTAGNRCATDNIYFPHGSDQFPIRKNLPELLARRNFVDKENTYFISNPEKYFSDLKNCDVELEKLQGELTFAKHCRLHKSIFSSRSDIKMLNTEVQNYIVNILEPLLVISYKLGNEYPHAILEEIWKLMFENAAHDSAGSCCSDATNEDVYMRYKKANDLAVNLVELHSRMIATKIQNVKQSEFTLTLLNTLPNMRSEVMETEMYISDEEFAFYDSKGKKVEYTILSKEDVTEYILAQTIRLNPSKEIYVPKKVYLAKVAIDVQTLPALGYEQYSVVLDETSEVKLVQRNQLENQFYKIDINKNGTIDIFDKQAGILYKEQCIIVDNGDDGDSFDYSPPREDYKLQSNEVATNVSYEIAGSSIHQQATITFTMKLPYDLKKRALHECDVDSNLTLFIRLKKDSNIIEFDLEVENTVLSHRMCVLFDAQIASKFNYADQQFGAIKRPNVYEAEMKSYLKGLGIKDSEVRVDLDLCKLDQTKTTWEEPPIAIEPTQSYVTLASEKSGICILPKGVREYEIQGEAGNIISLTLFRTYGVMGKSNLVYRPGRASGESIIKTNDAQLLKKMRFSFGFTSYHTPMNKAKLSVLAKQFNTSIQTYSYADFLNGRSIFTLVDVEKDKQMNFSLMETMNELTISAIKKWEHGDGIIVRLFNGLYKEIQTDEIHINFDFNEVYRVDSFEHILEPLENNGNCVVMDNIDHCKFITILIR